jgi:phosphatidylinositol-3,4,5-trisphosphate 3-phosphatase and dual-specificity protein phosphatase PTEN
MDWLRKIVSGKRNRFKDDTYNLDITYVTKRVLGMSFPASGVETMYRNNINDVIYTKYWNRLLQIINFLREKHNRNYLIFNMSGRTYDTSKFD